MLPQTVKVMKKLRELNRFLENSSKINEYVDLYLDECILTNSTLNLIMPWSLSRSFTKRYCDQGTKFYPTKGEERLFGKEIPTIISLLKANNFNFNWWLVFSRSYIRTKAISEDLEQEYAFMILNLIEKYELEIAVINWEDDVICMGHKPNTKIMQDENFFKIIQKKDFEFELSRRKERSKYILKLKVEDEELIKETKFKIACEAEEGVFLMENKNNPICDPGKFLFLILGKAERYHFFSTLTPEFKKRIVCVLKPYPWRI